MAHRTYTTEAFVLGGSAQGEANRYVALLSRNLGFLRAVAKSARTERSKLRYSLQDYALSQVSLVRGKDVWRVVGASEHFNAALGPQANENRVLLARLSSLLRRLVQGEESHPELFDALLGLLQFLREEPSASEEERFNAESITVLRILFQLGYLAPAPTLDSFLERSTIDANVLQAALPIRRELITMINRSLSETQL